MCNNSELIIYVQSSLGGGGIQTNRQTDAHTTDVVTYGPVRTTLLT